MIVAEPPELQKQFLEVLQQRCDYAQTHVIVNRPIDTLTWTKADRPACWKIIDDMGDYTLLQDVAWGRYALFRELALVDIWEFKLPVKPFAAHGFVIFNCDESDFDSWFFIPACNA